jgi:hypothetical protein
MPRRGQRRERAEDTREVVEELEAKDEPAGEGDVCA